MGQVSWSNPRKKLLCGIAALSLVLISVLPAQAQAAPAPESSVVPQDYCHQSLDGVLSKGKRAVAIKGEEDGILTNHLKPKSLVDVVLTFRDAQDSMTKSRVVAEMAKVLSICQGPGKNYTVTLETELLDALRIDSAKGSGAVTLLLRAPGDTKRAVVAK